jgi:tetratricopeptide (TPR) repeat protein
MQKDQRSIKLVNMLAIMAPFFIVTAVSIAIFCALYVGTRVKYTRLKNETTVFKDDIKALQIRVNNLMNEKEINDTKMLSVLQWQYMLKDQVNQAGQQLLDRVDKAAAAKKDPALLNLLYYNLGLSYTMAVDFDRAIIAFEEAVKYNPHDAQSCYNLGLLYSINAKDADKAAMYYMEYLQQAPSASNAEEVRGKIKALEKK